MARLKFVGRKKEIKKFGKFIHSEAKRVLLVIGKQGIGKTRLLEQLELECYNLTDIEPLVYSYQIKGTDPPEQYLYQIMDEIWMKKSVFSRIIDQYGEIIKRSIGRIPGLGAILRNITESVFRDPRRPVTDRFKIFLQEIVEGFKKKNQRFVLFIDPLDELSSATHKDAWKAITQNLPYQIKIIIAQRERDVLVNGIGLINHEDIECWTLGCLSDKVTKDLVKAELAYAKPSHKFIDEFTNRYKGDPLLIDGAIKLLKKSKDFTSQALKKLPIPRLTKLLYEKLEDEERNLINHLSILVIPVTMAFLRDFTKIVEGRLDGLLRRYNVKDVIKEEENGKRTYQIYHHTLRDFVLTEMEKTDVDITTLHRKASKAFFKILEEDERNSDALKYSTAHLLWGGEKEIYVEKVKEWIRKKYRYGLISIVFEESTNCIEICDQLKLDPNYKASFLNRIGLVYQDKGNLQDALSSYMEALNIYKKSQNEEAQTKPLGNIGLVYWSKGDLKSALDYHMQALEIDRKVGNIGGEADDLGNIGIIYHEEGNLKEALTYHEQALKIDQRLKNDVGEANDLGNIGLIYSDMGDCDKSLSYLKEALEIDRKIGRVSGIANDLFNIAAVYEDKKEFKSSLRYFQKSLSYYEKVGLEQDIKESSDAIERIKKKIKEE
ncbi:MAG: tetratricopeptide repeat protein [Candidatus Zixiibacteriota bacterium]